MDVKKEVFAKLDKIAKPGAILASNTSYLNINEIAASISRPQDVVGMHFFSPANIMKLLEVVRGDKTAPDVLLAAMQIGKKIKKVPVVAGVCHGFIGNRMLMPRQIEATKLLLEGATPEQVDRVHVEFGMPMGPFQMADLAGVDIGWHRDPSRIETIRDALAGDRTLLAAERTYAAWVRTALAALAGGIGARALVKDILPLWVGKLTGTVLVVFAGFCLVAAIWRELQGIERVGEDIPPIPKALLVPMNFFLMLVAIAALIGIWSA
jgi:3-hydroxyacyl-CoA dehydrogenase